MYFGSLALFFFLAPARPTSLPDTKGIVSVVYFFPFGFLFLDDDQGPELHQGRAREREKNN